MPPAPSRRWSLLSSAGVRDALSGARFLVLPVGAIEAHGPHLPLSADVIQAESTAAAIAERLGGLVAPTLPYGNCVAASPFPGTLSVSLAALSRGTEEILRGLVRAGARRLLVLSGHGEGGHMAALRDAATAVIAEASDVRAVVLCDYDFVYELRGTKAPPSDGHAGLLETSRVWALAPELVGPPPGPSEFRRSRWLAGPPSPAEWAESVIGDPRGASPELGRQVQSYVLDRLEAELRQAWAL